MAMKIVNGRVVTPDDIVQQGEVVIRDGIITQVGQQVPFTDDTIIDAQGSYVLPGLVDIHGDDIEREIHPRENAEVDPQIAVTAADRVNILQGITTKFHAIAFEDTPAEQRTIDSAFTLSRAIRTSTSLLTDNRVHARCELSSMDSATVEAVFNEVDPDLVSLMHHKPGGAQYPDTSSFAQRFQYQGRGDVVKLEQLVARRQSLQSSMHDSVVDLIASQALARDIPLASHDDDTAEQVASMADFGISVCEFPTTMEAATAARDQGLFTVMGAPNFVRGGSLWDNLAAERAVHEGVVDILASDYHPPSLLASIFIGSEGSLPERVARVTSNPAEAVGLTARGKIVPGFRGDVIIVDAHPTSTVERVIIEGKECLNVKGTTQKSSPATSLLPR